MSNLLISYPNINDADYRWLQAIRQQYDPMYFRVVRPHITLVFGTEKLHAHELHQHAVKKVKDIKRFSIVLDQTRVVEDDSKKFFHTFLVPSAGYDEVNQLHDLLYTDELRSELRHDIPFIPHLGIGTDEHKYKMDELAHRINLQNVHIKGLVDKICVASYDGMKVSDNFIISLS